METHLLMVSPSLVYAAVVHAAATVVAIASPADAASTISAAAISTAASAVNGLTQLLAGRALRPGVTEHLTHPRTLREYAKRVTQALVKAQHTAAKMIYTCHSSRHKHLLLHRQQAEEEATAVHKQRVANKTDYQAVVGVLVSLQRQVRASVPQ